MASQSTVRIVLLSGFFGDGRAIQFFVLETWEMPLTWPTALSTVSLPVQGTSARVAQARPFRDDVKDRAGGNRRRRSQAGTAPAMPIRALALVESNVPVKVVESPFPNCSVLVFKVVPPA